MLSLKAKLGATMTGLASTNKFVGYSFTEYKFTVTRKLQLIHLIYRVRLSRPKFNLSKKIGQHQPRVIKNFKSLQSETRQQLLLV